MSTASPTAPAPAPAPAPDEARTRATWAEAYFDLVLIFGVSQESQVLYESPRLAALLKVLAVLLPLWWSWVSMTLALNAFSETHAQRLLLFVAGLATFSMGVCGPEVFADRTAALVFAGSYLALRVLMAQSIHRSTALSHSINHHVFGSTVAALLLLAALLPGVWREAAWGVLVLAEAGAPLVHRHRLRGMTFGPSHLPERFGLFIIIALGECIASTGLSATGTTIRPVALMALSLSFVTGCALWWLYFHFAASAVEHALRTHRTQAVVVRDVLSYGHFALVVGLLLVAVGAARIVADPTAVPHSSSACLMPVGAGLFTLTFGFTRWRMFGAASSTRLGTGLCLMLLAAAAPGLPALLVLGLTSALLVGVNLVEYWMLASGRSVPLLFHREVDLRP